MSGKPPTDRDERTLGPDDERSHSVSSRQSLTSFTRPLLDVGSCVGFSDAGNDVTFHALMRPASEKRQGTKSREVGQRWCSERYGDYMLAPIWNCARNASTTSPACLQQVRSGECNSHFVARSERYSGPSAH
jgi:hypothetical protein